VLRSRYEYRRRLPHYQKAACPTFISFHKATTIPLRACRDIVLQCCLRGNNYKFHLHAAVVMPEHVHLLLTPLRDANGEMFYLADILKGIKGASARNVNQLLQTSGPLWQEESFDHVVRSDESLAQKMEIYSAESR
jgi:REP element-mobilizing transposase RayT